MGTGKVSATQLQGIKIDALGLKAKEYRGFIIQHFTEIEMFYEGIITSYFCDDPQKGIELGYRLISTELCPFSTKKIMVEFIIKNHYPEFATKYPTLNDDVQFLMKLRNKVAHWKLRTRMSDIDEFNGDKIILLNFQAKKHKIENPDLIEIENKTMQDYELKMAKLRVSLGELWNTIEHKRDQLTSKNNQPA